jgi:hypothetical protein
MVEQNTVLLVGQNLFFLGRMAVLAEAQGLGLLRAPDEATFWKHFDSQNPLLVLVDLEGEESIWSKVLQGIQGTKEGVKVVAFGPHENTAALEKAKRLGCDLVLNKGEFNRDLPKIFQAIGSDV